MKQIFIRIGKNPSIVFFIILSFVILSFLLFLVIDVFNIFGIKYIMLNNLDIPYFWYHWYNMPVESPLQWYILGITLLIFAINAGVAIEQQKKDIYVFWLLMSLGLMLMLVEDAGDVRHHIRGLLFGGSWTYGILGTVFEFLYFSVIGLILVFAFFKYRNVFWKKDKIRNYLIIGYLFYGLGVAFSFVGSAFSAVLGFSFYDKAGQIIFSKLMLRDEISRMIYEQAIYHNEFVVFLFMDRLLEESLELIGAAGLLTAGIYFFAYSKSIKN